MKQKFSNSFKCDFYIKQTVNGAVSAGGGAESLKNIPLLTLYLLVVLCSCTCTRMRVRACVRACERERVRERGGGSLLLQIMH
jgi:hypothetical protein